MLAQRTEVGGMCLGKNAQDEAAGRKKEKGNFQIRWKEEEKCPTAAGREEAKTKQSCKEVNERARES